MRIVVNGWDSFATTLLVMSTNSILEAFPPPSYDYSTDVDTYDAKIEAYERSKFGGKMNPSLLDLKHLNYLDLSYNNFNGTQIPKWGV